MAMFNGRNVFLGYINGKDILLDKLIYRYDPSIGKSLSQASYDLITPESNKYYAISSEFEQISELYNVYNLSQEEYEKLSTYGKNSLYIIKDNDEITNSYVGDIRLDKLYQGGEELWKSSYPEYDPSKTYNDGDIFVFNGKTYVVDSVNGSYIQSGNLITSETWSASNGFISGKIPTFTGSEMPETYTSRWDYRTSGYVEVVGGATYLLKPGGSYSTMDRDMCHNLYAVKDTRISHIKFFGTDYLNQQLSIPTGCNYIRLGLGSANYQPNPQFCRLYVDMPKVRELEE